MPKKSKNQICPGSTQGGPDGRFRGDLKGGGTDKRPENAQKAPKIPQNRSWVIWGTFGQNFENRPDREISGPQGGPDGRFKGDFKVNWKIKRSKKVEKTSKNVSEMFLGHLGSILGKFDFLTFWACGATSRPICYIL